jgi:hypothetical protein
VGFRAFSAYFHGVIRRFIGTFYRDLLTPCVCSVCRVARRERPARCAFPAGVRTGVALHRAALCMPYAAALLSPESGSLARLRVHGLESVVATSWRGLILALTTTEPAIVPVHAVLWLDDESTT